MDDAPQLEPRRAGAWRAFLEAHAAVIDLLDQQHRDAEVPLTQYDVLVQLSEAEGRRLRMQGLAEAVLLSKSGLTRLVDRMERAGMVRREPCPDDRRGTFAVLTDTGYQALRRTVPTHVAGVIEHFADALEDDEAVVLQAALERVAAKARQALAREH